MEQFNPIARDFIEFCVSRRGKEWPALYDEMCWVAGRRLFQGLGYAELRNLGLSFGLSNLENTLKLVDSVVAQE